MEIYISSLIRDYTIRIHALLTFLKKQKTSLAVAMGLKCTVKLQEIVGCSIHFGWTITELHKTQQSQFGLSP